MATEQPGNGPAPSVEERMSNLFAADAGEAQPEVAADASASDDQVVQTEEPEQPSEEGSDEQEEPKEASLAIEIDGQKYTHDELKSAVHGYKDYTQKTQRVAAFGDQLSAKEQILAFNERFANETRELDLNIAKLELVAGMYGTQAEQSQSSEDKMLAAYQQTRIEKEIAKLKEEKEGKKQKAHAEFGQVFGEFSAKRDKALRSLIPVWNETADSEATSAALAAGFSPNEIKYQFDARNGLLAWKAAQFDKLQASKSAAVAKVKAAPPVLKPGASANQNTAAQLKYKEARSRLKKSGDLKDAAALFMGLK